MAKNFPVFVKDDGEEVTVISGSSIGTHGGSFNLSRGYLQTLEFISKTSSLELQS